MLVTIPQASGCRLQKGGSCYDGRKAYSFLFCYFVANQTCSNTNSLHPNCDSSTAVCHTATVTSFCVWMQEQAGNSFLQRGRLLQARLCADGECGGHLQEGGWHLCQVCHGLPAGYALPSQSWHHRSLWLWRSSDTQQVGSAVLMQLHNRHPDSSTTAASGHGDPQICNRSAQSLLSSFSCTTGILT